MPAPPEAPLSRTDDRRTLLLALGAAGVTLAVVLGIIGLPAVNACSADPRGVVTCLRDMADRKFDLPGSVPGPAAGTAPAEQPALPAVVAAAHPPAASGGPLQAPALEFTSAPIEQAVAPAPPVEALAEAELPSLPPAPLAPASLELPATPLPQLEPAPPTPEAPVDAAEPGPLTPEDTALSWSGLPVASDAEEPAAKASNVRQDAPTAAAVNAPPSTQPAPSEPAPSPANAQQPEPIAPLPTRPPAAPLVVANAEPATAQPPPSVVAAPVILAPTIDAIELDAGQSSVSGSGPAGALMRLYADGVLIGESPVEEGRWLVESSNLLDRPRRELRVEAIEPDTGKLLGVAAITVEVELPDGGAPPDERPEHAPDLGSGVAPTAPTGSASPIAPGPASTLPPPAGSEFADNEAPTVDTAPSAPELAVLEPEVEPEPLPPLATVVPRGESASVEILAPSSLEPTVLPFADPDADDQSTTLLATPDAPALIAAFDVSYPQPATPPGQPVTILRLLPFGDPDEGRYNVGKAIIRHGDTLWSVARRYYGHGIHYRTIFHANRELICRPSRIFPGQVFDLPLVTDD